MKRKEREAEREGKTQRERALNLQSLEPHI